MGAPISVRQSSLSIMVSRNKMFASRYVYEEKAMKELVEPMGFESASHKEIKEFCGAARPSKELKRKGGNP